MKIEEIDLEDAWNKITKMPFGDQIVFLSTLLVQMMKNITLVANAYRELQAEREKDAEELKSVVKAMSGAMATDEVVRGILKGGTKSMEDKEFWRKERDKVKSMTDGWYII